MKKIVYLLPSVIGLIALLGGTLMMVSADSHDQTFYGCLYGGSLSQVNTVGLPSSCGRGVAVSWNAQGVPGEQGEPGEQGDPGLVWQGEWAADFNDSNGYAQDDAVHHMGSAWISLTDDNTEEPSDSATNWDLLAAQGEQGPEGPPGDGGGGLEVYDRYNAQAFGGGSGITVTSVAMCDEGDRVIGGGYQARNADFPDDTLDRFFSHVSSNGATKDLDGWRVVLFRETTGGTGVLIAHAVCIDIDDGGA